MFRRLTDESVRDLTRGTGAYLGNGDFFEGEFRGFDGKAVTLNSLLFGSRHFDVPREVAAVALAKAAADGAARGPWRVTTADGSVHAGKVTVDADHWVVEEPSLGTVRLPAAEVVEVRAANEPGGR